MGLLLFGIWLSLIALVSLCGAYCLGTEGYIGLCKLPDHLYLQRCAKILMVLLIIAFIGVGITGIKEATDILLRSVVGIFLFILGYSLTLVFSVFFCRVYNIIRFIRGLKRKA